MKDFLQQSERKKYILTLEPKDLFQSKHLTGTGFPTDDEGNLIRLRMLRKAVFFSSELELKHLRSIPRTSLAERSAVTEYVEKNKLRTVDEILAAEGVFAVLSSPGCYDMRVRKILKETAILVFQKLGLNTNRILFSSTIPATSLLSMGT